MDTSDPRSRSYRVNVTVKVHLKYPNRDAFVERFSQNISRTGVFVRDPNPLAAGTMVDFDYRLSDDTQVLQGRGLVRWVRPPHEAHEPDLPPGMGIEFMHLDNATQGMVDTIVERFGEGKRAPKRVLEDAQDPDELARAVAFEDTNMEGLHGPDDAALAAVLAEKNGSAAEETLILDLVGATWRFANAYEQRAVRPLWRNEGDIWVPNVLHWLGESWPCAAASAMARRAGVTLVQDQSGGVAVMWGRSYVTPETVLAQTLEQALDAFPGEWQAAVVIVPNTLSERGELLLRVILGNAGFGKVEMLRAGAALLANTRMAIKTDQLALTICLDEFSASLALVDSTLHVQHAHDAVDLGLVDLEEILLRDAATQLLRVHTVDVEADPTMRAELREQIYGLRTLAEPPWEISVIGADLTLTHDLLRPLLAPLSERLVLHCETMLRGHNIKPEQLRKVVIGGEARVWLGAAEALETQFGIVPMILKDGAWSRIAGARRCFSLSGAKLAQHEA